MQENKTIPDLEFCFLLGACLASSAAYTKKSEAETRIKEKKSNDL